jgi:hypothetical protein
MSVLKALPAACVAALLASGPALAQWSIGRPDSITVPAGENQYLYLVRTSPLAGYEQAFNDAYQNVHMGDLVQLDGWVGAQRFRIVNDVAPHPTTNGYRYDYLIVWDLQGRRRPPSSQVGDAINGGKSRRIPGFDYVNPDAAWSATYRALGPKRRRPDGQGPFMPAANDNKTPRPNRYVLLEFDNPPPGVSDADFEAALERRVAQVLTVRGWMTAQRLRYEAVPLSAGRVASPADRYLTVWETEGQSAQQVHDALAQAVKDGKVAPMTRDASTAESTWWLPISPFIDKSDFSR